MYIKNLEGRLCRSALCLNNVAVPEDNFYRVSNSVSLRREESSVFIPNVFRICFGFQTIIK